MNLDNNLGIVIQARKGSSRLPGKMAMSFYNRQSLLEIILRKLQKVGIAKNVQVVLATTVNTKDDELESIAKNIGVEVIRGSEEDVLSRFIQAADYYGFEKIIRVCGDNPFLISEDIGRLIDAFQVKNNLDYLSFRVNDKPSILTHFGLWTEAVKASALRKVAKDIDDPFYHEHVTNYIYAHPEIFKVDWILLNDVRFAKENVRLTIDTPEDFEIISSIYGDLNQKDGEVGFSDLFEFIESRPDLAKMMQEQIKNNTK